MSNINRCVVRNAAYRRGGLGIRERHNERKNQGYANADIDAERTALNVHFKTCEDGYAEAFDRLLKAGTISTRGLGKDPKIVDELVFDVNTRYFEERGGYEYAKEFFEEAYRFAVKEAGGEQYILSAVMHADERNAALSEELGRDAYHYHLHVVYVPVVEKEVKWSKRCKDPALAGTTKEVICQVSHSKKWSSEKAADENGSVILKENGRAVLINAYSLLQDRYAGHMRAAGYLDVERGERGSTAAHLHTLDYKIQQDNARLEGLENKLQRREKKLSDIEKQLASGEKARAVYGELEGMGKKTLLGRMELQQKEFDKLLSLAKSGLSSQIQLEDLRRKLAQAAKSVEIYRARWEELKADTTEYMEFKQRFPEQAGLLLEELRQQALPVKAHRERDKARRQER